MCVCYSVVALIGATSPAMRVAVLWVFRYETSDVVCAEACCAVTLLDLDCTDVIAVLQQHYFVEESDIVPR